MIENKKLPPATMIMTFHKEGDLALKSLLGMQRVRSYSAQFGNEVRLICMLDNADEKTEQIVKSYIQQCGTLYDQVIETAFGSPAAARNVGIDNTTTEYVGFLDGDDFLSKNWVQAALTKLVESRHLSLICTPSYIISFGNKVEHLKSLPSRQIPIPVLVNNNFWGAPTFGFISTYRTYPYNERVNTQTKFAYEDWDFNTRCIVNGIEMVPVEDTYIFYRRREHSVLTQHAAHKSFIPPSDFLDKVIL